ncbi:Trk system potassium transporter TrkA, partial [Halobiforma nitratireducens]
MRIVIVGAGEVGRAIASNLEDSHDIVVIDRDPEVVEELTYALDVLALQGDGTELGTLEEADVSAADLAIACTDDDEANVVICGAVKTASDAFTIARVRRRSLLETWEGSQGAFGVDFMVCTDLLTARTIVRISDLPATQDVDAFVGGLVRMAEFEIGSESPIAGLTVEDADCYESLTFAGVFRGEEMIVATGETEIRPGDRIVVIGSSASVSDFATDVVPAMTDDGNEVVVV